VVSGSLGGSLGSSVVLVLGFSSLVSDGLAMGLGDFISSQAEVDYAKAEMRRERWEFENFAQGEIDEMIEIYKEKGLSQDDASELVHVLAKNKDNFIQTMMVEELGMMPPEQEESWVPAAQGGGVTFGAFAVCGLIPLLPYVISQIINGTTVGGNLQLLLFGLACALVGITLFILGALTSRFTIHTWYKAGFYMLLLGTIAAASSYAIGLAVDKIVNGISAPSPPVTNFTFAPGPALAPS